MSCARSGVKLKGHSEQKFAIAMRQVKNLSTKTIKSEKKRERKGNSCHWQLSSSASAAKEIQMKKQNVLGKQVVTSSLSLQTGKQYQYFPKFFKSESIIHDVRVPPPPMFGNFYSWKLKKKLIPYGISHALKGI